MDAHALPQICDLIRLIPYAAIIVDEEGQIVRINRLAQQLFGYSPDDLIGRPVDALLLEPFRDQHVQHVASYTTNPETRPMGSRLNLVALRQDGREIPIEVGLSPLISDNDLLVLAVIRDITRRQQQEQKLHDSREQLRELSAHLVSLREEERSRISLLIHDELGQMLTGLKMDLVWLQKRLARDREPLLDKMKAMSELIDTSIQSVRQISTELRPRILDDIGLEAAVELHLQEFQQRTDIHCALRSDMKESSLDAGLVTTAFRIFQEALTNVARHAQATRIDVTLVETVSELSLHVRDNGRGITDSELKDPKSIGLLGMHERARMQAGQIEIQGAAGRGTTLSLRLPLARGRGETRD